MEELYLVSSPLSISSGGCTGRGPRVSVIGVPLDSTASYRPGTRFGPVSVRSAYNNIEAYSMRRNLDVDDYCLEDLGDVAVVPGDVEESLRRIEVVAGSLFGASDVVGALGGEHLLTLPLIRALRATGKTPCIVVLDAHLDLREDYMGLRLSHASVMRRIGELVGYDRIFYLGTRAVAREELEFARRKGIPFVSSMQARLLGTREVVRRIRRFAEGCEVLYVSVDMDVYDPAYAPGVGNPESEGMEPWMVLDVLSALVDERLVGFDVVEVSPPYDTGGITSVLAAKTLLEMLASIYAVKAKQP